jgi:hypothetical protein
MNAKTRHLHGLRAAGTLVGLVRQLDHDEHIKLSTCEIDLDNGDKHRLKAKEYLELAETAIGKAIEELKGQHQHPQPGLN